MQYTDPFLEEQKRIAGIPAGQEGVQVAMPSLQQGTKGDRFINEGNELLAGIIASKSAKPKESAQPQVPQSMEGKTQEQIMAETGQQTALDQMNKTGTQPSPEVFKTAQPTLEQPLQQPLPVSEVKGAPVEVSQPLPQKPVEMSQEKLPEVFGDQATVTSRANRYYNDNPAYGVNAGTDFHAKEGTPVALPGSDEWEVVSSRNDVTKRAPGDFSASQNHGWGNSIEVRNTKTGEKMRYSHLQSGSVPDLKPGQLIKGGTVVGGVGNTGNTRGQTGLHLDVEYYDEAGKRQDVLNSRYGSAF